MSVTVADLSDAEALVYYNALAVWGRQGREKVNQLQALQSQLEVAGMSATMVADAVAQEAARLDAAMGALPTPESIQVLMQGGE